MEIQVKLFISTKALTGHPYPDLQYHNILQFSFAPIFNLAISCFGISKRIKNICSHEVSYIGAHSNVIHKNHKVDGTQIFIHQQRDKQMVVYPNNGILFSHKKEGSTVYMTQYA